MIKNFKNFFSNQSNFKSFKAFNFHGANSFYYFKTTKELKKPTNTNIKNIPDLKTFINNSTDINKNNNNTKGKNKNKK